MNNGRPPASPKLTPKIASREPSPLTLPPAALSNKSQKILDLLFTQKNTNSRFESRCSSHDHFNNQAFGDDSFLEDVIAKIDNPQFPVFRRLQLNDLADILANTDCSNFRFVVLNIGGTLQMLFSMRAGKIFKGTALSHSMLACGKEETSECVAAGMIYFHKEGDKWSINKLSNHTGHFKSSIETLIAPLILLLEQDTVSFAADVVLELVNNDESSDEVAISLDHLKAYYQQRVLLKVLEPTQTQCERIANKPIAKGDPVIIPVPQNYIPILASAPVVDQNDIPITVPVQEQNFTPILSTTQSIFRTPIKRNLANKDEDLDADVTGHQFTPREKR